MATNKSEKTWVDELGTAVGGLLKRKSKSSTPASDAVKPVRNLKKNIIASRFTDLDDAAQKLKDAGHDANTVDAMAQHAKTAFKRHIADLGVEDIYFDKD
jgi:hypothetical protein